VLGLVKDAARRKRGGLRPSLTSPARGVCAGAGRDEGTVFLPNQGTWSAAHSSQALAARSVSQGVPRATTVLA
jgi:hypothetical protein